jgi:hypothetical protein
MSTPKPPKRPADFVQRAYQVFQEAVGEQPESEDRVLVVDSGAMPQEPAASPEPTPKNQHAVALSKLGAKKGGEARAASMTREQRIELARKAAMARWKKRLA